jgi:hypothetical protein
VKAPPIMPIDVPLRFGGIARDMSTHPPGYETRRMTTNIARLNRVSTKYSRKANTKLVYQGGSTDSAGTQVNDTANLTLLWKGREPNIGSAVRADANAFRAIIETDFWVCRTLKRIFTVPAWCPRTAYSIVNRFRGGAGGAILIGGRELCMVSPEPHPRTRSRCRLSVDASFDAEHGLLPTHDLLKSLARGADRSRPRPPAERDRPFGAAATALNSPSSPKTSSLWLDFRAEPDRQASSDQAPAPTPSRNRQLASIVFNRPAGSPHEPISRNRQTARADPREKSAS